MDTNLRFLMANETFCKMIGYSKDRLLAIKYSDLRAQGMIKYLKDSGESVTDAINSRRVTNGQSTFESPSGLHIVARGNVPLVSDGNVKFVYITYSDITRIEKNREYMGREIDEFIQAYDKMAAGDLTVSHTVEAPKDPDLQDTFEVLTKLRTSVRGIIANLQVNIRAVNKQMVSLTSAADNASRSVDDASKSVNQIAKNSGVVSENAQKASEGVEQMTKAMQDMSAAVEEITSSMESVSSQANNANTSAKSGAVLAGDVNKNMTEITTSTNNVYGIVKDIEKQMNDIGKIIVLDP